MIKKEKYSNIFSYTSRTTKIKYLTTTICWYERNFLIVFSWGIYLLNKFLELVELHIKTYKSWRICKEATLSTTDELTLDLENIKWNFGHPFIHLPLQHNREPSNGAKIQMAQPNAARAGEDNRRIHVHIRPMLMSRGESVN